MRNFGISVTPLACSIGCWHGKARPDRPVHQHGLLGADVLLHRAHLGHPRRRDGDPVARGQRQVLGDDADGGRRRRESARGGTAGCATTGWARGRRAPRRPAGTGSPSGPRGRTPVRRSGPGVRPLNTLSPVMVPAAVITTSGCASSGGWQLDTTPRSACSAAAAGPRRRCPPSAPAPGPGRRAAAPSSR